MGQLDRQTSIRTEMRAQGATYSGLCFHLVMMAPMVALGLMALTTATAIDADPSSRSTCLRPDQILSGRRLAEAAGATPPAPAPSPTPTPTPVSPEASAGSTSPLAYPQGDAVELNKEWEDLVHYTKVYGIMVLVSCCFSAVTVLAMLALLLRGAECLCAVVVFPLAVCGGLCLAIPQLVVLVLFVSSWSELEEPCHDNDYFQKIDTIAKLANVMFILGCCCACGQGVDKTAKDYEAAELGEGEDEPIASSSIA